MAAYATSILLICLMLLGNAAMAGQKLAEGASPEASEYQSSVADFEAEVRRIAEKTAAEEKIRKEQERLDAAAKAKAAPSFKFFKYRKDGATAYSDRVPHKADYQVIVYNSCYACNPLSKVDWRLTKLYMTDFSYSINQAARRYDVDPALVRAMIHAESNFNPLARSRKGAMGLMQLMPDTAKELGVIDSTNASQNIQGGVKYLAYLLKRFQGDITLATAAYNAGPGAVTKHKGVPPYEETKTYVFRVNVLFQRYQTQAALARN